MTLWSAMSFGFLTSTAASVRWNSDKLRIMVFADMIAIFSGANAEISALLDRFRGRRDFVYCPVGTGVPGGLAFCKLHLNSTR